MWISGRSYRAVLASCLAGAAGLVQIAPSAALAEGGRLSVEATPRVLYTGQTATVNVRAHLPSVPPRIAPYAFAAAEFDVYASAPMWSFACEGQIVGSDVLGIAAGQPHAPQEGLFASPVNPYGIWQGVFTAGFEEPALIEVAAEPTSFAIYPRKWSASSIVEEAEAGREFIFVNPLDVGSWIAAPGSGTTLEVIDDVIVDGRIITAENPPTVRMAMLLPAVQSARESTARVGFEEPPTHFAATVELENRQRTRIGSMQLTFDGQTTGAGGYVAGAQFAFGDGSVRGVRYGAYLGGVWVASGDLGDGLAPNGGMPELVVQAVPDTLAARIGPGGTIWSAPVASPIAVWTARYDLPVTAVVRGALGRPRVVTIDRIEVQGVGEAARRLPSSNNLKQLGLACHHFEASGVTSMSIIPAQPE